MLTGKRFKLVTPSLAIVSVDGRRSAVTIPAGTVIKVVSGPSSTSDPLVDVLLDGQVVKMFTIDVNERGAEIVES
jgi:hypothetical protein